MRLGRHLSDEAKAWQSLVEAWDASIGELKVKVERAEERAAQDEEVSDDEGR